MTADDVTLTEAERDALRWTQTGPWDAFERTYAAVECILADRLAAVQAEAVVWIERLAAVEDMLAVAEAERDAATGAGAREHVLTEECWCGPQTVRVDALANPPAEVER